MSEREQLPPATAADRPGEGACRTGGPVDLPTGADAGGAARAADVPARPARPDSDRRR